MKKAVLFDIDGVLIDSELANRKYHQELLERIGDRKIPPKEIVPFFSSTLEGMIQHFYPNLIKEELEKAVNFGENFYPRFYRYVKLEKNIKSILRILSQKYLLGVVTSRLNAKVLNFFKLRNYFKTIITFKDSVHHKPHPEPLLLALKKIGVKAENSVYIGDSELDQKAAKAGGLKFIAFRNPSLPSKYQANRLSQLPNLLKEIFRIS
jgi:HAD superfamily hydrolase (TIGR01509 family)